MATEEYQFKAKRIEIIDEGGDQFFKVYFQGEQDNTGQLQINGYIPSVPAMEYFQAGLDGTVGDLIRNYVMEKLGVVEDEPAE